MISHLLNTILMGILFFDYLERKFPEQLRNFATDVVYNALYLYSKTQIYITSVSKKITDFIESKPVLANIKNQIETILKPKNQIVTITEFIKNGEKISAEEANTCDFALFSWLSDDKKCVNKKIIYDINEPMIMAEFSNIRFILVELLIGDDKIYKIDFKTDDYNFYLVGNKFTKAFFVYYVNNYLNIQTPISENDKYSLRIIDHEINKVEYEFTDKNESIILERNHYKLLGI